MRDDPTIVHHAFRAMGTAVLLLGEPGHAAPPAARLVQAIFAREERRFSRFRADSELSRVNEHAGTWTDVSPGFAALVSFALEAARRTAGRFDPTVLPALQAAGYDRDFDEILAGSRSAVRSALRPPAVCGRWPEIRLRGHRLLLPAGVALDLGGVAKGWTVDLAVEAAVAAGLGWALVNAGGDLRLGGAPPPAGVLVAIDDPADPDVELATLVLHDGALATSSVARRAWAPGLHHLIDPATGRPADTGVVQSTTWAPTCAEAEIRAKAALLGGPEALGSVTGTVVRADGTVVTNVDLAATRTGTA